ELTKVLQPALLIYLLGYFQPCSTMSTLTGWLLASGIILMPVITTIFFHPYFYRMQMYALQLRLAYSGLVYRKVLRLSGRSANTISSGQITNILSNDVSQVETALHFINHLWVAPLEVMIVPIFFWYFGSNFYVSFIAIGYTVMLFCFQSLYGKLLVKFR
ncbi:unnamed protein product, partial [Didymodactylos carnosus]